MAALQLSQETHNGGNEQNELALAHSGGWWSGGLKCGQRAQERKVWGF